MRGDLATVLRALAVLGCVGAAGCVVARPPPRAVVVYAPAPASYRFYGPHPIPDNLGGGWCPVEGYHFHPYPGPPAPNWNYVSGSYYYAGPPICAFGGPHPIPGGGWCFISYPHSHNYCPTPAFTAYYHWDAGRRVYLYSAPPPAYRGPGALYVAPHPLQPSTTFHRAQQP